MGGFIYIIVRMMTYNHDYLAWKQRVRKEIVTFNEFYDYFNSEQGGEVQSRDLLRPVESSRSSAKTSTLPSTPNIMRKIQELESELQAERIKTLQIEEQLNNKKISYASLFLISCFVYPLLQQINQLGLNCPNCM